MKTPTPWPSGVLRRACATNFGELYCIYRERTLAWTNDDCDLGFGGANAAVVLEASTPESMASLLAGKGTVASTLRSAVETTITLPKLAGDAFANSNETSGPQRQLFVFSAKSDASLVSYLKSLAEYLEDQVDCTNYFTGLSFTLGQHRNHFTHRYAIASGSLGELKEKLSSTTSFSGKTLSARDPTVGFVFTGQGAQYPQMVTELQHIPPFSAALDRADGIIRKLGASWSLLGMSRDFITYSSMEH